MLTLFLWVIYRNQKQVNIEETEEDGNLDRVQTAAKLPPGNSGWPAIGETIEFVLDGRKFFRTRRMKYGSVFRSHLCGLPTVVVIGAENVQKVLTASESSLIVSPSSSFQKLFGRGALTSTLGARHSQLQRSVSTLFTPRNLSMFVSPIQQVIREHVTRWRDAGQVVYGSDSCRQMTLSIIWQCLFGFDLDREEVTRVTQLFQIFSDGVFALPVNLPGFAFHKAMKARDELKRYVSERSSMSSDNKNRLSMLDILHSTGFDDPERKVNGVNNDLSDLIIELLFASIESTASAMCTALIELSENKTVLRSLRRELADNGLAPGVPVDYETIRRLSYTSDVVKETLRVQPPIAGAFRRTCKPFHIQDYVIPPGWMILYGITDTHEASTSFDEVEKFSPDRWKNVKLDRPREHPIDTSKPKPHLAEAHNSEPIVEMTSRQSQQTTIEAARQTKQQTTTEASKQTTMRTINKYEYIPFGAGSKRFCVGQSMAKMVLNIFLIELANGTNGWRLINGRPEIKTAPIPFPKDHLPIQFNHHHGIRSSGVL